MTRARIRLETTSSIAELVKILNSDGSIDKYVLEDFEGAYQVNARSYLGVLYAFAEFGGNIYLVNKTEDGKYPIEIDKFRPLF